MAATSKAFRARIGKLSDHDIDLLHRWASQHCALSSVLRGDKGSIVLVGLKDLRRTAASFARTIRTAMRALAIPTLNTLRGHWCHLITEAECILLCTSSEPSVDPRHAPSATAGGHGKGGALAESAAQAHREQDSDRVVSLP